MNYRENKCHVIEHHNILHTNGWTGKSSNEIRIRCPKKYSVDPNIQEVTNFYNFCAKCYAEQEQEMWPHSQHSVKPQSILTLLGFFGKEKPTTTGSSEKIYDQTNHMAGKRRRRKEDEEGKIWPIADKHKSPTHLRAPLNPSINNPSKSN